MNDILCIRHLPETYIYIYRDRTPLHVLTGFWAHTSATSPATTNNFSLGYDASSRCRIQNGLNLRLFSKCSQTCTHSLSNTRTVFTKPVQRSRPPLSRLSYDCSNFCQAAVKTACLGKSTKSPSAPACHAPSLRGKRSHYQVSNNTRCVCWLGCYCAPGSS